MNTAQIQKNINQYHLYMEEIVHRGDVLTRIFDRQKSGGALTGYKETDIDLVHLQLRKITELIMFGCVVAREASGDRLNKILTKNYRPKQLKAALEKLNLSQSYFPIAVYDKEPIEGIRNVGHLKDTGAVFASVSDLVDVFNRAGHYLHANRKSPYGNEKAINKLFERAADDHNNIMSLLNHHWIHVSKIQQIAVVMKGHKDGKVGVTLMVQEKSPL